MSAPQLLACTIVKAEAADDASAPSTRPPTVSSKLSRMDDEGDSASAVHGDAVDTREVEASTPGEVELGRCRGKEVSGHP